MFVMNLSAATIFSSCLRSTSATLDTEKLKYWAHLGTKMNAFHPSKPHSDRARWVCIYPAYLNSKKSRKQGRIVSESIAVENPTHQEISDVLNAHGFRYGIENKQYSREPSKELLYRGRIRVQLKNDDGTPFKPDYPTREAVMNLLAESIPKLKSRVGKQSSSESQAASTSTSGKKGKGKGKR